MKTQFRSFTPKAMKALGSEITVMLEKLQEERRASAAEEAESRKVFRSELRSGVRALLDRCEMTRETLASDIQAASTAFATSRPRQPPPPPRKVATHPAKSSTLASRSSRAKRH